MKSALMTDLHWLAYVPPVKATTEGVVRAPSAFSMTLAALPSMTETQELVVPRSIPMTWPVTPSDLCRTLLLLLRMLYFEATICACAGTWIEKGCTGQSGKRDETCSIIEVCTY